MPIINLQDSDIALGMVILVLRGEREGLPIRSIYDGAERLVSEWPATTPSWRSLLRRAVRFLAKQGIVVEAKKGHWKLRWAK